MADTEIEVKKGDYLWKIASAHLLERDGKEPSAKEISKLVDLIVERNKIKNPDLIFPGERFIIPSEQ